MKIAICDNDQSTVDLIARYIKEWEKSRRQIAPVTQSIVEFNSAEAFLFNWSPTTDFDLIFLDIELGNLSGIELAKVIRKIDQDIQIVFVTGYREHVLKGYEVEALNFLIKPISQEDCFKCLDRTAKKTASLDERSLLISVRKKTRRIGYSDIIYFESFDNATVVHTKTGEYKFRKRLGDVRAELDPEQFVSIHRSFIVNIAHVNAISKKTLTFDCLDAELPISQARWQEVNKIFIEYHMQ